MPSKTSTVPQETSMRVKDVLAYFEYRYENLYQHTVLIGTFVALAVPLSCLPLSYNVDEFDF